ncbi:hypothetical protein MSIMFI_02046 [Mycobacterium simulans]|nr:hypothetical protein MSIMFI_02046 [Mycobacterium simulans]
MRTVGAVAALLGAVLAMLLTGCTQLESGDLGPGRSPLIGMSSHSLDAAPGVNAVNYQ